MPGKRISSKISDAFVLSIVVFVLTGGSAQVLPGAEAARDAVPQSVAEPTALPVSG